MDSLRIMLMDSWGVYGDGLAKELDDVLTEEQVDRLVEEYDDVWSIGER